MKYGSLWLQIDLIHYGLDEFVGPGSSSAVLYCSSPAINIVDGYCAASTHVDCIVIKATTVNSLAERGGSGHHSYALSAMIRGDADPGQVVLDFRVKWTKQEFLPPLSEDLAKFGPLRRGA